MHFFSYENQLHYLLIFMRILLNSLEHLIDLNEPIWIMVRVYMHYSTLLDKNILLAVSKKYSDLLDCILILMHSLMMFVMVRVNLPMAAVSASYEFLMTSARIRNFWHQKKFLIFLFLPWA